MSFRALVAAIAFFCLFGSSVLAGDGIDNSATPAGSSYGSGAGGTVARGDSREHGGPAETTGKMAVGAAMGAMVPGCRGVCAAIGAIGGWVVDGLTGGWGSGRDGRDSGSSYSDTPAAQGGAATRGF